MKKYTPGSYTIAAMLGNQGSKIVQPIQLISFGYGFLPKEEVPPPADYVVDVRRTLRNPHIDLAFLRRTDGRQPELQEFVFSTPGAPELIEDLLQFARKYPSCTIAIGCVAGRHRSAALIEILAKRLEAAGTKVAVTHQHLEVALKETPLRWPNKK